MSDLQRAVQPIFSRLYCAGAVCTKKQCSDLSCAGDIKIKKCSNVQWGLAWAYTCIWFEFIQLVLSITQCVLKVRVRLLSNFYIFRGKNQYCFTCCKTDRLLTHWSPDMLTVFQQGVYILSLIIYFNFGFDFKNARVFLDSPTHYSGEKARFFYRRLWL